MSARYLSRCVALILPLTLAACGEPEQTYAPLSFSDLPPIQLKVDSIDVEQEFFPSGVDPDVSKFDPEPPVEALKAMAKDRLQTLGTSNKAVFAIHNASLTRLGDTITGSMDVTLTILDDNGNQQGYAEARVTGKRTSEDHLRQTLYDLTQSMMNDMNVEFEYQIRHNLKPWLTDTVAPDTPVEQAPLEQPPSGS